MAVFQLHHIPDRFMSIQEAYEAEVLDMDHTPLGRIPSTYGDVTSEQVIASIMVDPGYPPRPLTPEEADYFIDDLHTVSSPWTRSW